MLSKNIFYSAVTERGADVQQVPSNMLNVQLSTYYEFVCIKCDLNSVSYEFALESGAAKAGRFPWNETVKVSINIWLVRIGLVISVDWEHGTGMDYTTPARTL